MGRYANFYGSKDHDRIYNADSFAEWLKPLFSSGVIQGEMQVTAHSNMTISIAKGNAYIDGKMKFFNEPTILTIEQAHPTLSRIDTVVVRRNDTLRDFTIQIIKGDASLNPAPIPPQRTNGIYDLVLAQITVDAAAIKITQSKIKDTRTNSNLCGWVVSPIQSLQFDQVIAQWKSYINEFKGNQEQAFNAWFNSIKQTLSGDQAGRLSALIEEVKSKLNTLTVTKTVTLNRNSWVGKVYTINDELITATSNQDILPVNLTNPPSQQDINYLEQYQSANFASAGQTNGKLYLCAMGEVPQSNLNIQIIFENRR